MFDCMSLHSSVLLSMLHVLLMSGCWLFVCLFFGSSCSLQLLFLLFLLQHQHLQQHKVLFFAPRFFFLSNHPSNKQTMQLPQQQQQQQLQLNNHNRELNDLKACTFSRFAVCNKQYFVVIANVQNSLHQQKQQHQQIVSTLSISNVRNQVRFYSKSFNTNIAGVVLFV